MLENALDGQPLVRGAHKPKIYGLDAAAAETVTVEGLERMIADKVCVVIDLADGRSLVQYFDVGVPADDLDAQEQRLIAKFRRLAEPILGVEKAKKIEDLVLGLDNAKGVTELMSAAG